MAEELVNVTIDGIAIAVPKGTTIIEAAKQAGVLVPHYCYHPSLPSPAVCRMCLVEVEKAPEADAGVRHRGGRGPGGACQQRQRQEGARGRAGAAADQPSRSTARSATRPASASFRTTCSRRAAPGPATPSTPSGTTRSRTSGRTSSTCLTAASSAPGASASWKTSREAPVLNVSERGDRAFIGISQDQRLDHPWSGNVVDLCPGGLAPLQGLPPQGARLGSRQDARASAPAAPRAATSASTPATTSWCGCVPGPTSR